MTGACMTCGAVGPLVRDHPEGRYRGKPLFLGVVPLCKECNRMKGRIDRAAGVEGGAPTPRLLVSRVGAWMGFLALSDVPPVLPGSVFADRAAALQVIAHMIPPDLPWGPQ